MYKSIEIADIIGFILSKNKTNNEFTFEYIDEILTEVRKQKPFISIETRIESIRNIMDLIDSEVVGEKNIISEGKIILPQIEGLQVRFERQYYRLDIETREILSDIINKIH